MPRKRMLIHKDQHDDFHSRSSKRYKSHVDSTKGKQTNLLPAVILSGFKWDAVVDVWITKALESYDALFMEVSLDLPTQETLAIKNIYGIQTDFIKVVCGSWSSQETLVLDLDQAILTWTMPCLVARKLDIMDGGRGDENREKPQVSLHHGMYSEPPQSIIEQSGREEQARVWVKLSDAVANARAHLLGDDLDTFEALIAKPLPGVDAMESVTRWICGGGPDPQPQTLEISGKEVKTKKSLDAGENKENIALNLRNAKDITMDDELAERGLQFGQTGLVLSGRNGILRYVAMKRRILADYCMYVLENSVRVC
ncbi:uncharacterized protein RCO7_01765 [Rhynchosporium graminicola]|uniref:Uncharacterized protein n=1 Tax=Rhynchosporium graminicola TaxID=2792576 RepID=A0A1E1KPT9_9HELO|nr:uncharacterized protein RCO7_01765 [Rhynchosporium commune]